MATWSDIEQKLRRLVAGKLGLKEIPDAVWNYERVREYVDPALNAYCSTFGPYDPKVNWETAEEEISDLVSVVKELMPVYGGESHAHPGRSVTTKWDGNFNKNEKLRAQVLNGYFARLAADSAEVQRFRYKLRSGGEDPYLREGEGLELTAIERHRMVESELSERPAILPDEYSPLTDDEAAQLLASEATRYMSVEQFKEWGIPVLGHRVHTWRPADSATLEGLAEHKGSKVWLTFEDPEACFILRAPDTSVVIDGFKLDASRPAPPYPVRTHAGDDSEGAVFAVALQGEHWDWLEGLTEEQESKLSVIRKRVEEQAAWLPVNRTVHTSLSNELHYPECTRPSDGEEEWFFRECEVWPGSVLDDLRALSEYLARSYHWDPAWATWFVLTGDRPPIKILDASTHRIGGGDFTDAYVEFKLLPWVSSKTLLELYKQIQDGLFGGDNQPIRARNLELFRFVEKQRGNDGKLPPWRTMLKQWNASRPIDWDTTSPKQTWEYTNERTMCRDYKRVREHLLHYDYMAASLARQAKEEASED